MPSALAPALDYPYPNFHTSTCGRFSQSFSTKILSKYGSATFLQLKHRPECFQAMSFYLKKTNFFICRFVLIVMSEKLQSLFKKEVVMRVVRPRHNSKQTSSIVEKAGSSLQKHYLLEDSHINMLSGKTHRYMKKLIHFNR